MHPLFKQGLSIIEILISISLIAIAMLGITGFIQTQNISSLNLSISAKNINGQRYLEKLIWAEHIGVPGADSNCQLDSNSVSQIGLGATQQCLKIQNQSELDPSSVQANVYPIKCDQSNSQIVCRTTSLSAGQSTLVKAALQSIPVLSTLNGPLNIKCQITTQTQNKDAEILSANCPLGNIIIAPTLPNYLLIFQGNLKSDGFIKYYYPDINYQNSSS